MKTQTLQTHISIEEKEAIEHQKAKDLEFMGVMFMMMLIMLIPINYFLNRRQRLSNKKKKLGEFHIAFIIVAHVLIYTLFGSLIIPALMQLVGLFIKSDYTIYILFPLYIFLLAKLGLYTLNHYLDKVIYLENNHFKIMLYSLILAFVIMIFIYKIIWSFFGFSYLSLFYGILFLGGFYFMLKKYFVVGKREVR
jgi:hypothetical protein